MPATKPTETAVADYLATLAPDRRAQIDPVVKFVRKHVPKGYEEAVSRKTIVWAVPFTLLPKTYNGQPLWYLALAAQKNYNALYLMNAYGIPRLRKLLETGFKKAGKKLDMGKSCLLFKTMDDLDLDSVGQVIADTPVDKYIEAYHASRKKAAR